MQKGCSRVKNLRSTSHTPCIINYASHPWWTHRGTYIGHSSSTTPYSCQGNLAITAKVAGGKAQGPAIRGNSGVDQVEVCLKLFGTCKANRWEWTYIVEYNLLNILYINYMQIQSSISYIHTSAFFETKTKRKFLSISRSKRHLQRLWSKLERVCTATNCLPPQGVWNELEKSRQTRKENRSICEILDWRDFCPKCHTKKSAEDHKWKRWQSYRTSMLCNPQSWMNHWM